MPLKGRIRPDEKITIVEAYLSGKKSSSEIIRTLGINNTTLGEWVRLYRTRGSEGLIPARKFKKYSAELKLQVITEYLDGKASLRELCEKYDISSDKMVRDWLKVYNGQKGFKNPSSGSGIYMTKGRKTTLEERIEIVSYCIENGKDYGKAIEKYQISYQQIYSWVHKYEESGVDKLTDKRGKRKSFDEMTEVERLRAENRVLQAENRWKDMEIDILKKVQEVERRRG